MQSPLLSFPEYARLHALIPPGTRRLCLFATYPGPGARFAPAALEYIRHLMRHFDRVVVLANQDKAVESPPFPSVAVMLVPNLCRDMGMWWRVLVPLAVSRLEAHPSLASLVALALVNDSCEVAPTPKNNTDAAMDGIFEWGWKQPEGLWGVSKSFEIAPHVQSYFLVAHGRRAVHELLDFARENDVFAYADKSKPELVEEFEVGLSRAIAAADPPLALSAMYDSRSLCARSGGSRFHSNPSYGMWDVMLREGCPLVKKLRRGIPPHLQLAHT